MHKVLHKHITTTHPSNNKTYEDIPDILFWPWHGETCEPVWYCSKICPDMYPTYGKICLEQPHLGQVICCHKRCDKFKLYYGFDFEVFLLIKRGPLHINCDVPWVVSHDKLNCQAIECGDVRYFKNWMSGIKGNCPSYRYYIFSLAIFGFVSRWSLYIVWNRKVAERTLWRPQALNLGTNLAACCCKLPFAFASHLLASQRLCCSCSISRRSSPLSSVISQIRLCLAFLWRLMHSKVCQTLSWRTKSWLLCHWGRCSAPLLFIFYVNDIATYLTFTMLREALVAEIYKTTFFQICIFWWYREIHYKHGECI